MSRLPKNTVYVWDGSLLLLGFGSFVEKKLLNPCTGDQNCTSPFSYKNLLTLTRNGQEFNTLVGQQQIDGNLDSPEGGFDAIMQVAVCGVSNMFYIIFRDSFPDIDQA